MTSPQKIQFRPSAEATEQQFDWGRLTWFADRAQGNQDEITVGRCILLPGQENPRHYHPNCSEVLTVISGRIAHTISDREEVEMEPGDTVNIPPNIWHQARNTGDGEAVLFIAFSSAERQTVGET